MKLHNLRLFQAACQHQGIMKAAQALNLSQPPITYAIKELETEFNVALLSKKGRSFVLTKEGEVFYQLCNEFLARADAMERTLHEVAQQNKIIHIGIPPMLGAMLSRKIESEIKKQFPEISIHFCELGTETIKKRLLNGELDCAICPGSDTDGDFFECLSVGETEYVCCVSPNHSLAEEFLVSLEQLKDEQIVVLDPTFDNHLFVCSSFKKQGINPKIVSETNQLETFRNAIAANKAIGFAYKGYAELYPGLMVRLSVKDIGAKQKINFIWPKNLSITSNLTKVISGLSSLEKLI